MLKNLPAKLLIAALLLVPSISQAATITVTATALTQRETDAATWKLAQINAARTAQKLATFPTLKAWCEDLLQNSVLPAIVKEHAEATATTEDLKTYWEAATPAQRTAAVNLLKGQ